MAANNITLLLIYTIGVCRYCTIVSTDREYCALLLTNDSVLRQKKNKMKFKKKDSMTTCLLFYLYI